MRSWFWRALACSGGAFAGCGALCVFKPVNGESFTEAWLFSSSEADASVAPIDRSRRRQRRARCEIANECEAFLAGRYHELLLGNHHQALPAWALINPLAHADYTDLKRLADSSPGPDDSMAFLSYLAEEVLLHTDGDDVSLQRIQHDALVPLELSLLHHASSSDPAEIARIIGDRLEHRSSRTASEQFQQSRRSQDGDPTTMQRPTDDSAIELYSRLRRFTRRRNRHG